MIEYEWTAPGKLPDDHRDDRVVSSVRVSIGPMHARIRVWNRGKLAGELYVDADDWPEFVSLLGFRPDEGKLLR